jgi:hypothetical protein
MWVRNGDVFGQSDLRYRAVTPSEQIRPFFQAKGQIIYLGWGTTLAEMLFKSGYKIALFLGGQVFSSSYSFLKIAQRRKGSRGVWQRVRSRIKAE